jgi:hypothetical protein
MVRGGCRGHRDRMNVVVMIQRVNGIRVILKQGVIYRIDTVMLDWSW